MWDWIEVFGLEVWQKSGGERTVRGNEKFPPSKGRWKRREINALFGNFLFEERGYLRIKESAPSSIMDVGDLIPCDAEFSWN